MQIGLISDTHGLLPTDVHRALAGVDLILHAGDVGGRDVLDDLEMIAPVRAVRGNTDPRHASRLVERIDDTFEGVRVHVSHGHELGAPRLALLLATYDADVIVYGHTHVALVHRAADGRLVVNLGAANQPRDEKPPTVARLTLRDGHADVELVALAT